MVDLGIEELTVDRPQAVPALELKDLVRTTSFRLTGGKGRNPLGTRLGSATAPPTTRNSSIRFATRSGLSVLPRSMPRPSSRIASVLAR